VAAETKPSAQSRIPALQKIQVNDKFWAEGSAVGDLKHYSHAKGNDNFEFAPYLAC
jgi:hypothetical protein